MWGCLSVRLSSWDSLALTGRIFIKFGIWVLVEKSVEKNSSFVQMWQELWVIYMDAYVTYLHDNMSLNFSSSENYSWKICRQTETTHFMVNNFLFENSAVYDIMWENTLDPERTQTTIWPMRFACWIPKATDAHTKYVTITAFSTAGIITRKPLSVMLHVQCQSVFIYWPLKQGVSKTTRLHHVHRSVELGGGDFKYWYSHLFVCITLERVLKHKSCGI